MARHLAVFAPEAIEKIFSGVKKVEGRFSQVRIPPFGKVSAGDTVLIKKPGEKIVGQFLVDRVVYFDHPTKEEIEQVKRKYGSGMALPKIFWLDKEKINYITLMFIKSVTKFIVEPQIPKRDLRPWVVLE
ncbi:hypothetical protein A2362_04075 [Candidatus Curtissbacteria bacterium RIFOXYB1_FULL_41_59]|uniref:ASCH domain-containing protein n=1 Tax=Candidatus Curtissbacteria bacterium RIFOXYA1_FULL_41_14 TaxID=1797737 RepID=A0A1F5HFT8_9BACT|nr:MAG: hypothetical protein UT95_C0038G0007 [Candidatus Curtissbacteria bacterium GW2011_GWB1_40_28]KKR75348.1 MAG: hypothetical protein UU19_C0060G0003 [Candidatus Curtissbacteria bacterium GW2011_GWD1_40_8]KKS01221.1 MAG: hypothetical protein UU53_C0016G0008 [Candidatus Curtissbacteria bacterium GW2011_GWC2_41_21]OGD79012.1 MAG: hypothetical protein A2683_00650 [Candidatus Curtissbacteria bacterium RIFCSPHIGHO2_01_FULL_34_40]OGE03033.1 MAG: hypothetical protein A2196_01200 [Candidatus Curtis